MLESELLESQLLAYKLSHNDMILRQCLTAQKPFSARTCLASSSESRILIGDPYSDFASFQSTSTTQAVGLDIRLTSWKKAFLSSTLCRTLANRTRSTDSLGDSCMAYISIYCFYDIWVHFGVGNVFF
jgi:hypothetical protein